MGAPATILVVDDEESVVVTLAAVLEREGYEVLIAGSAAAALDLLPDHQVDVAVLDMRLEDAEGLDLLQALRKEQPDCSAIMLTGYASLESSIQALRAGAYDYLIKPCDLTELKHRVAHGAERVALLRAARAHEQELKDRVAQATADLAARVDELQRTQANLTRMVRTREEFLAAAAHDMGNPLTLIKGFAQLARRQTGRLEESSPLLIDALEEVEAGAMRLSGLLDEFLDATLLQMGESIILNRAPVDLVKLAEGAVKAQRRLTDSHQLLVDADPVEVAGEWDARRLERVLGNLLSNAVKYSPAGGEVVVKVGSEAGPSGGWAVLSVEDHGVGIRSEDLARVFDQFARGENVTGMIPGLGIGLASVRRIVEEHGGTVDLASEEGCGTIVTVRLPLKVESAADWPPTFAPVRLHREVGLAQERAARGR